MFLRKLHVIKYKSNIPLIPADFPHSMAPVTLKNGIKDTFLIA